MKLHVVAEEYMLWYSTVSLRVIFIILGSEFSGTHDHILLSEGSGSLQNHSLSVKTPLAEQSRAVAYCRQLASTVTLGIEPRWDPWPYICSVSRRFFFFFLCSSFDKREELGFFFIIGVPLLHLIPPEVTLK
jgi:hypothetical protein